MQSYFTITIWAIASIEFFCTSGSVEDNSRIRGSIPLAVCIATLLVNSVAINDKARAANS